ncbi:MAG: hypothetical protein HYR76_05945 [Ignavibacteria bacterium]|nr:hypothetical protein [Ignavibacteria bacterium]
MKILTRVILIILIQSGWLLAQEREWSISLMGGKEVSKVSLVTVREDSLIILQPGKLRSVSVDSIVKIGFDERGSRAVQGCAVGVVAAFIRYASDEYRW